MSRDQPGRSRLQLVQASGDVGQISVKSRSVSLNLGQSRLQLVQAKREVNLLLSDRVGQVDLVAEEQDRHVRRQRP